DQAGGESRLMAQVTGYIALADPQGDFDLAGIQSVLDKAGAVYFTVRTLDEVVQKLRDKIGKTKVHALDIVGHGQPGVLSVSPNLDESASYALDTDCASYRQLDELRSMIARPDPAAAGGDAHWGLRLIGCNVGGHLHSGLDSGPGYYRDGTVLQF